ncbi:MAG: transcriptional repressor NrdR [Candidatus Aenigmarchaeota archaeon]|nr:transcriptional repressor NrdR [Candidatus Aenigmarchaeota archaeon]
MKCPECNFLETKVIESRDLDDSISVRRRRECLKCSFRFTTYERIEVPILSVIKKNKSRELFDREKLARGIYKAMEKRPVPAEEVEELVSDIEKELRSKAENEVTSKEIGRLVMEKLKEVDQVAYIRFASVYKSFADVRTFEKEVKNILKKSETKI